MNAAVRNMTEPMMTTIAGNLFIGNAPLYYRRAVLLADPLGRSSDIRGRQIRRESGQQSPGSIEWIYNQSFQCRGCMCRAPAGYVERDYAGVAYPGTIVSAGLAGG